MRRMAQIVIAASTVIILVVAAIVISGNVGTVMAIPAAAKESVEDKITDIKNDHTDPDDRDHVYYNDLAYEAWEANPDEWTHPNYFSGPDAEGHDVWEQVQIIAAETGEDVLDVVLDIFDVRINPGSRKYDPSLLAFHCCMVEEKENAPVILVDEKKDLTNLMTVEQRYKAMQDRISKAHKHFLRDHKYAEECYARLYDTFIIDKAHIEEIGSYTSGSYAIHDGLDGNKPLIIVAETNGYGGWKLVIPLTFGGASESRINCGFQGLNSELWWPPKPGNPPVPENPPHEDPPPEEDYGKDPDGGTMTEKGNDPRFGGGANKDEQKDDTDKEVTSETESPDKPYVAPAAPEADGDGGGSDSSTDDPKWGDRVSEESESGSNAVDKGKSDPEVTVGNDTNKGGDFANRADQIHDEPEKPVVNNSGGGSDSNSGSNSNTDTSQTQEPGQSQPATVTSEPSAPGGEFRPIE